MGFLADLYFGGFFYFRQKKKKKKKEKSLISVEALCVLCMRAPHGGVSYICGFYTVICKSYTVISTVVLGE